MVPKYLTVKDAARLLGVTDRAVFKAVDHHNIPGEKEVVNRKTEVRIPAPQFLVCLQRKKEKLMKELQHLQNSENLLRRHINGN